MRDDSNGEIRFVIRYLEKIWIFTEITIFPFFIKLGFFSGLTSSLFDTDYDEQDPLSRYDVFFHSTIIESGVKSELDYYLDEPILPRISDFDV